MTSHSMTRSKVLLALLIAAWSAGCVTRADYEKVRREQQEMRALLADTQVAVDKLNRRVDTVQTGANDQKAGGPAVKGLERRVAALEAQVGTMAQVKTTAPIEMTTPPPPQAGGGGGLPSPHTEAAPIAMRREDERLRGGTVDETYKNGLQLYRDGQAPRAIDQLRQFLRGAKSSDLADNAQYWIGESYYNTKDYNRAIIELNEVLLKYPQGDQVPGALLALATAFADSGDKIDARLILQKLISDHPKSEEAEIGRRQMQALAE
jgi:tol-pal system protein YbgF